MILIHCLQNFGRERSLEKNLLEGQFDSFISVREATFELLNKTLTEIFGRLSKKRVSRSSTKWRGIGKVGYFYYSVRSVLNLQGIINLQLERTLFEIIKYTLLWGIFFRIIIALPLTVNPTFRSITWLVNIKACNMARLNFP